MFRRTFGGKNKASEPSGETERMEIEEGLSKVDLGASRNRPLRRGKQFREDELIEAMESIKAERENNIWELRLGEISKRISEEVVKGVLRNLANPEKKIQIEEDS